MRLFSIIILFTFATSLAGQQANNAHSHVYGLDPLLYNGKKYSFFLPSSAAGHQYLISEDFLAGEVTVKGKTYSDLIMNYDIYNQQLLLKYEDENGAINIIELSKAWMESFRLANMVFLCLDVGDGPRFYQVNGDGRVRILYHWKKDFKLGHDAGPVNYTFTPGTRTTYLYVDGRLTSFRGKKGLVKLLGPEKKEAVAAYIRKHHIHMKTASDRKMSALANYITIIME